MSLFFSLNCALSAELCIGDGLDGFLCEEVGNVSFSQNSAMSHSFEDDFGSTFTHIKIAAHDTDRLSRVQESISFSATCLMSVHHKLACSDQVKFCLSYPPFFDPSLVLEKKR